MTDITMLERFKCAGMLMLHGIAAPLALSFKYASGGYDEVVQDSCLTLDTLTGLRYSGGAGMARLVIGFVMGAAVLANAVVEAPYQLIRSTPPQSRPWLQRRFDL